MALYVMFWQENSSINSNTNLAVYGQGLLRLTGEGDAIRAQRLSLSLFYNITVRVVFLLTIFSSSVFLLYTSLYSFQCGWVLRSYASHLLELFQMEGFFSLLTSYYSQIGPGSLLEAPLEDDKSKTM